TRPEKVKNDIAKFQNTGNIKKPMITVHGTWDALLFTTVHTAPYEALVKKAGKNDSYRLYMIEHGNHFDGLVGNPAVDKQNQLQALLPYIHQSFDLLVEWVEKGVAPPAGKIIGFPGSPDNAFDLVTGKEVKKY
ncbi:MAG: 3-hydroxybutyrate oligomer hydrolase family protein, partial [Eubacteriales bacterium]